MAQSISTFKGTRDISGDDMRFRMYVLDTICKTYQLFGFEPLETPVLERSETLLGKYGEEAEKLLFMLAKPFDYGGLRYDHTVPLARYCAGNWNDLSKPYKRFAIGPVFRGESPQSGRYRQFTQCDFDTVGSDSPMVDAEIAAINNTVLRRLGFTDEYVISFNDRRLLNAMIEEMEFTDSEAVSAVLRAWDKLDKVSVDKTLTYLTKELDSSGISADDIRVMYYELTKSLKQLASVGNKKALSELRKLFQSEKVAIEIDRIEELYNLIMSLGVSDQSVQFNPLLARGLSYYTGPIFETIVVKGGVGSISGGGRYDNLIADLGGPELPASGSSFGVDRLIVVMEELGLRPESSQTTKVFVALFDRANNELTAKSYELAAMLRSGDIATDIYNGGSSQLGKQIKTAVDKRIPFLLILGPDELAQGKVTIRDLSTREETRIEFDNLVETVRNL